jgi:ATP-binding cassette subfamily B protein
VGCPADRAAAGSDRNCAGEQVAGATRLIDVTPWLRRLLRYCGAHRALVVTTCVASVLAALLATAVPLVVRHVIDSLLGPGDHHVWAWVAVLVGAALAQYAARYATRVSAARLGQGVHYDLRRDIFDSLARLDGAARGSLNTGQVVSRSITDVGVVGGTITMLPFVANSALMFLISLAVMLVLSPLLTVVALALAPAMWLVSRGSRRDLFPANWDASQKAGELVGHVEAAVTGVRVVKGFGQEARELATVQRQARRLFASRVRAVRMQAWYGSTLAAIPALGQVAVLLLGGWLALNGHLSLGTFLAFSTYIALLVGQVDAFTEVLVVGPVARASFARILDVVDTAPGLTDAPDAIDLPDGPVGIEFDDVHFGYGAAEVLSGLTLTVAPGETVAIVGAAGSGKSTLLQLVSRFYDPASGAVRVGGVDVRRLRAASLRATTGVVFDDSFLFSDTIAANIAYGRPDATPEQIRAAAALAEADGFIERLPEGYDTVIGERGMTLSGGQRQRIALARALLPAPRLLVLDDATSAVDPRVEARINARLRRASLNGASRATLLVAHRHSTLELADRVVVLAGGRAVASGTVEELRRSSAEFRRLFYPDEADAAAVQVSANASRTGSLDTAAVRHAAAVMSGARRPETFARDGGIAGAAAATDDLLARVAALPPATDEPDVPDSLTHPADPRFSLARLLRPVRVALLTGLVLVGLEALAQLLMPAVVRGGIDRGVSTGSLPTLFALTAAGLAIVLGQWLVSRYGQRVTGRTGERLLYLLRVKTFAQLQRLGLDYYEREPAGRIMTRMTTDVDALSSFLQTGLLQLFVSLVTLVGVLVALVLLDGALSLVLLAMLPLLVAATLVFRRTVVPTYGAAREAVSAVNASLQENVAGLRITQAYVREARNRELFLGRARAYREARVRSLRYAAVYFPAIGLLSGVAAALVLGFGAGRLRAGTLTAGELIAFFLYLDAFFAPVQDLSTVFDGYQQASVGLARLRDLLRTPTSTPQAADPLPVPHLSGEIALRDVSFRYSGADSDAVSDLDVRINAGETVALVGETGAGKSTVIKLVARFYDPTAGSVLLDGHELRALDLGAYRRRIGLVPQEPYLSAGTVADAIAYGRPDATPAEIEVAARAVGAHDAIEALPGGYGHPVTERGGNLSAGQRQLIALARAELVQPDILLLDEATAALDLASEAVVANATRELSRRRTTLVVAHRLTTAARADRILVLDGGRVVESGSHEKLLAAGGTYAELWASYADRTIETSRAI